MIMKAKNIEYNLTGGRLGYIVFPVCVYLMREKNAYNTQYTVGIECLKWGLTLCIKLKYI